MGAGTSRTGVTACAGCGQRNRVPVAARGRVRCSSCQRDLPWLVDAGDDEFSAAVRQAPVPVLVDVWAPWCGPCRTMGPIIEQLSRELAGRMKVVKVNADEAPAWPGRSVSRGSRPWRCSYKARNARGSWARKRLRSCVAGCMTTSAPSTRPIRSGAECSARTQRRRRRLRSWPPHEGRTEGLHRELPARRVMQTRPATRRLRPR
jgi:thioredoxin 2